MQTRVAVISMILEAGSDVAGVNALLHEFAPYVLGAFDAAAYKTQQYDLLADAVRAGLDMDLVYRALRREI